MRILLWSVAVAALLLVGAGSAQAQHVDAIVYDQDGNLTIGGLDFDNVVFVEGQVIFEGELGDPNAEIGEVSADGQFRGDEPGFNSVSDAAVTGGLLPLGADNLPGGTAVTMDLLLGVGGRSISFWDGTGAVSWSATPDSEVLEIDSTTFGGGVSVVDGSAAETGIVIGTTAADGLLHNHIEFGILGDGTATPDAVTEGIYLVEAQLNATGYSDPTDPFFIIFATLTELNEEDLEASIELAEAWVESNLVPEPGSLMLIVSGLLGMATFGRRRA